MSKQCHRNGNPCHFADCATSGLCLHVSEEEYIRKLERDLEAIQLSENEWRVRAERAERERNEARAVARDCLDAISADCWPVLWDRIVALGSPDE